MCVLEIQTQYLNGGLPFRSTNLGVSAAAFPSDEGFRVRGKPHSLGGYGFNRDIEP